MKRLGILTFIFCALLALSKAADAQLLSPRSEPVRLIPPVGHTRYVSDLATSADGRLAASCGWDNSAIVWETATARIVRRLPLAAKGRWIRFSDSDHALVTVEDKNRIIWWNIETGKPRWAVTVPLEIESVSIRGDGKAVAVAGTDPAKSGAATTIVYQADTGAVLQTFGASSQISQKGVTEILYSPDGRILYGYSGLDFFRYQDTKNASPNPLFAFDAASGAQLKSFTAVGAAAACSPNGKFLLTRGKGSAAWRDARSGAVLRTFQKDMSGDKEPRAITLSPDGTRFAMVTNSNGFSSDGTIREYSLADGTPLHKTTVNGVGPDNTLVYLPNRANDGDRGVLVTLNEGQHAFCRVDVTTGGIVQNFRGGVGVFHTPAALSPDGQTIFLPNGAQTGIVGWDITKRDAQSLFLSTDKKNKDSSPPLAYPVVSRDGRLLVTPGISDKHVFVSDLRTRTTIADIPVTINPLSEGIALHPTGEWIAVSVGATNYRDAVNLYSAKGMLLRELHPPASGTDPLFIRAVASDQSGNRVLISDYDGRLFVFDFATGSLLQTFGVKSTSSREAIGTIVPIGTDKDRVLITRDSGEVAELDLATGETVPVNIGGTVEGRLLAATSGDGKLIAFGRPDGSVVLQKRSTPAVSTLIGHTGRLIALAFSPDGKRLTSLGSDGMVRFWNTGTGEEQASLLVFTRQPSALVSFLLDPAQATREGIMANIPQWIVYNARGQFEGSDVATRQVHFAKGTQTYSADQFFERYYHSGLLASIFTDAVAAPEPSNDILHSLQIGTPPLVKIVSPLLNGKTASSATVSITVNATEQAGGGVKAIRFYQNERLIGGPSALRGIAVEAVSGATTTKTFTVSLTSGENTFRAVAYSKSDLESVPAMLTVTYTPPKITNPNLYVLVVGINAYRDSAMNLAYARPDAESLAAFFEKPGSPSSAGALFNTVKVFRLTDADATGAAIASGLSTVAASARPDDVVFLYFAGHGETADGTWYFLPHEMRQMALPERVKELGIPWSRIETAVGKIAARKIVIVVDACKSGAALSGALRGVDDESQTMAVMARAQGIHILTAATGQQYAAEVKELGHGILTYALLEGLNGKATASGGVMVRTLMSYVEDRVPELSKQYRGSEQYPVPFERGQNFPLVKN